MNFAFGKAWHLSQERTALIALKGDLSLHERDAVANGLPDPAAIDKLVIDCTAVTSIDSVVASVFLRYRRRFVAAGADPLNIIFIVSPQVKRLFEIAGMSTYFTLIASGTSEADSTKNSSF